MIGTKEARHPCDRDAHAVAWTQSDVIRDSPVNLGSVARTVAAICAHNLPMDVAISDITPDHIDAGQRQRDTLTSTP